MIKYIIGHDEIKDCYKILALEEHCSHCNQLISKKKRYLPLQFDNKKLANKVCKTLNEEYEKYITFKAINKLR